jgi:hypothetical protein
MSGSCRLIDVLPSHAELTIVHELDTPRGPLTSATASDSEDGSVDVQLTVDGISSDITLTQQDTLCSGRGNSNISPQATHLADRSAPTPL